MVNSNEEIEESEDTIEPPILPEVTFSKNSGAPGSVAQCVKICLAMRFFRKQTQPTKLLFKLRPVVILMDFLDSSCGFQH